MKSLQFFKKPNKLNQKPLQVLAKVKADIRKGVPHDKPTFTMPFVIRRVHGHSMIPVLPPDTTVVGSRWLKRLKVDDVIIFEHNGKEKIKRVSEIRPNEIFVLGDHNEESTDSRHFGWIPKESVVAVVIWPHVSKERIEKSSTS